VRPRAHIGAVGDRSGGREMAGGEHGRQAPAPGGGGNGSGRLGASARREARALNRPGRGIAVTTA
jgi:hypothetical protein